MAEIPRTVRHVVLVRFRDDATEEQRAEFIRRSQWSLEADYVSGYVSGWGVDPNPYGGSATDDWHWGMTLDVAEGDVLRYRDDPIHRAVGPAVSKYAERYAILDFVID
ncbi:MAG: Dabb family protein [Actinomycetota bacterium]